MSTHTAIFRLATAVALGLAAAQGCDSAATECATGTQGCSCAQDDACLGDLQCLSEVCVPLADSDDGGGEGQAEADADDGGQPGADAGDDDDGAGDGDGDGDGADGSDDGAGETGSSPPGDDPTACDRLLGCLADANPGALPEALAAYGPEGMCWTDGSLSDVCLTACAGLLRDYSQSTDVESCRECSTTADCGYADGTQCFAGSCVECIDDSHCPEERPTCSSTPAGTICTGPSSCGPYEVACPDASEWCIPSDYWCDGEVDCPGGADEVC